MLPASKAALSGIVLVLLATGISGPRPTLTREANLDKEVPVVENRTDVRKLQEALRDNGHYRGEVDGIIGLRTRASIRAYQTTENLPVTGQLDTKTAGQLGVSPEGHEEIGDATKKDKPSAGIKRAKGVRQTSKTPRKAAPFLKADRARRSFKPRTSTIHISADPF
jgi:peptidoglycan hydrolase-like protein with peptidoglycan-binding domain